MSDELKAQATELQEMVENHWRSLIRLAGVNPQMAGEEVFRFEALIEEMAKQYTPVQAAWFRGTLLGLRGKYAEWERTDPDGLRRTLNVTGGGRGNATAWLANLETPASIDLKDQQDQFWREILTTAISNQKLFEARWAQFIAHLQSQIVHLPQPEQDGIMTRVVLRNAQYISIAQQNRDALKAQLGVFATPPAASPVAAAIVETAVKATIWQGIGAIFRAFR